MKLHHLILIPLLILTSLTALSGSVKPWSHGALQVSGHYLSHADGTPFFWLSDTGWLLPERLDRDEVNYYLTKVSVAGFNVVHSDCQQCSGFQPEWRNVNAVWI